MDELIAEQDNIIAEQDKKNAEQDENMAEIVRNVKLIQSVVTAHFPGPTRPGRTLRNLKTTLYLLPGTSTIKNPST